MGPPLPSGAQNPGCSPSSSSPSKHSPAAGPGWSSGSEEPVGYPESARAAPAPPGGTACRQRTVNGRMLRATHLGRAVSPSSHPCVRPASQLPTVRVTLSAVPPRGVHCCLFSVSSMSPSSVCCQGSGGGIQALVHTQANPAATAASPSPASFPSALLCPPPPHPPQP